MNGPYVIKRDWEAFQKFLYKDLHRVPDPYYGERSAVTPCPFYKPGWNCSISTPKYSQINSSKKNERSDNRNGTDKNTPHSTEPTSLNSTKNQTD